MPSSFWPEEAPCGPLLTAAPQLLEALDRIAAETREWREDDPYFSSYRDEGGAPAVSIGNVESIIELASMVLRPRRRPAIVGVARQANWDGHAMAVSPPRTLVTRGPRLRRTHDRDKGSKRAPAPPIRQNASINVGRTLAPTRKINAGAAQSGRVAMPFWPRSIGYSPTGRGRVDLLPRFRDEKPFLFRGTRAGIRRRDGASSIGNSSPVSRAQAPSTRS